MITRRGAIIALFSAFSVTAYFSPFASAQAKADATGTWKWQQTGGFGGGGARRGGGGAPGGGGAAPGGGAPATQPGAAGAPGGGAPGAGRGPGGGGPGGRGGGAPTELTATLKQDGDKLTGSVVGFPGAADPAAKVDIKDGTVKADGTVEFKVVTSFAGRGGGPPTEITRTYTGKLDGDKITGTTTFEVPPGGFGGPGGGGAPGGGAPGAGRGPASQPAAGAAPGGAPGAGGPPGGGRAGGAGGFGGPQPWEATRQK